jgi:hypothetical protein
MEAISPKRLWGITGANPRADEVLENKTTGKNKMEENEGETN